MSGKWCAFAMVGCLILAVGVTEAVDCFSGCSDTHKAENHTTKNYNCWAFVDGTMCTVDTYDKIVQKKKGPCTTVVPTEQLQVWVCNCEEICANVNQAHKREMGPPPISLETCNYVGKTDKKDCLLGT